MAKFKVEVELEYLDEEATLDDQIKESIKQDIISKIKDTVMNDIQDTAVEIAENRIGIWINKFIQTMVSEKKIPYKTNEYGSKIEMISMEEMLGKKFEKTLNEYVDKDGKSTNSSYDRYGTKLEWLTGKLARKYADERIQDFVKNIKSDIQNYTSSKVKDEMMKQLTSQLVQNIDFNKLFKED